MNIIRPDIFHAGKLADCQVDRQRKSPVSLVAKALYALSFENASFDSNPQKDAEIKEAVRLYLESWVIPPLEQAYDKLKPKGKI